MKQIVTIMFVILTFLSCNLEEKMEKMNKMDTELENEFDHNDINTVQHWGTEEGDNYIQITFYNYNMSNKSYSDIKELAIKVNSFFKNQNTDFDKLEFIEVRFTEEDKNNAKSFVSFKYNE